MRPYMLAVLLIACMGTTAALGQGQSNDAGPSGDGSFMSSYGFAEHDDFNAKPATAILNLDQQKAVEHIKELRAMSLLNDNVTSETASKKPTVFAAGLLLQYAIATLKINYDNNPQLDKIHVTANAIEADDYGNDQTHQMISFDFTRSIYKKINWDKFLNANLAKVALNFKLSPYLMEHVQQERNEYN